MLTPANDDDKISTEGTDSQQTFYLKKVDGTVTESKTIDYKLDKTAPTDLKIQYNNSGFKSFLNIIIFGIFFKETVDVIVQATDSTSQVAGYQYYASDTEVTDFIGIS
ncbi:MAG: hypothetical protein PHQ72_09855 [Hespellia sp.]|nr:hypothetical protein [Hespellia sp.]